MSETDPKPGDTPEPEDKPADAAGADAPTDGDAAEDEAKE